MAYLTKEDKTVIQTLQTSDKEMKEIERAKKNKGKRSMGRKMSKEDLNQYAGIRREYDKKILEQNLKENNKILKEAQMPELTWEEVYGKEKKKKVNKNSVERCIEMVCYDDQLKVYVSDEGLEFASLMKTRFGKPDWKNKQGEMQWILPSKCFSFGGKGYQISKNKSDSNHGEVHILWTSHQPNAVYFQTTDIRWINHGAKLYEKYNAENKAKKCTARRKDGVFTEVSYYFHKDLMKVPNKK